MPRLASRLALNVGAGLLLLTLVLLVLAGPTAGLVAVGIAVVATAVAVLGPERVGFGFLGLAFVTAPFYKGLVPGDAAATPTDLLLVVAVVLLLPRIVIGRNRLAPPYVIGIAMVGITGALASAASVAPVYSLLTLAQWVICIAVLPIILMALNLDRVAIDRLAWAFVIGQVVSTAYALAVGPVGDGGRYDGLTQHPNAFAQSGMLAFALLLHLVRTVSRPWIAWTAMAVCLMSVYLSGSRGATLAIAVLVLLIPVVERSAAVTYLIAVVGVGGMLLLQQVVNHGGGGGSISRLTGGGSASGSNNIRIQTLHEGFDRFLQHPILGSGLIDLFWIHNNYLEVAVGIGVIGLVGYLVVIGSLARGLIGRSDARRLCYPVLGYAAFGATIPSLTDRSVWLAVALSVAVFHGFTEPPRVKDEPPEEPVSPRRELHLVGPPGDRS